MAVKTIQIRTSDISSVEIKSGEGQTLSFSVDGADYQIDLTDTEAQEFYQALDPYVRAAAKISGRRSTPRRSTASGRSTQELRSIREWAKAQGHNVSPRGRVKATIIAAYDKAHA